MRDLGRILATAGLCALAACGKVHDTPDATVADASPPDAAAAPTLATIAPAQGPVTTEVTLTGSHFGAAQGAGTVTFGPANAAAVQSWSDTQIVVTVPDVLPDAYDVAVTIAGGTTGAKPFRVVLPPMAYLDNDANDTTSGLNTITLMAFDAATGTLTQMGDPVPTGDTASGYGGCSSTLLLDEHHRRLFAPGSTAVAVYDIDPVSGALTAVTGSPFPTGGSWGYQPRLTADGKRLFVGNYNSKDISVFDVDLATGALTAVTGSPFATTVGDDTIALLPGEQFLYGNDYGGSYEGFAVATDGSLTSLGAATTFDGTAIEVRPGTSQLYITGSAGTITVLDVDPDTGAATPITGSPFAPTLPTGAIIDTPVFTADGNRLYIGPFSTGAIMGFDLAADGTPVAMTGSPWDFSTTMTSISCVAMSRGGGYLIAEDETNKTVGVFTVGADGTPMAVNGSPFAHTTPVSRASGLAITF
jgi:IPT/TIG domain/Lactonase, 7-bladed beta-propeller